MHTVFALLCFVVVIHWLIFPYPSGLLHWHCGNLTIAPKQPWWIWINISCEFIMNDCITTAKQSTTKPCAYFLGYTVYPMHFVIGTARITTCKLINSYPRCNSRFCIHWTIIYADIMLTTDVHRLPVSLIQFECFRSHQTTQVFEYVWDKTMTAIAKKQQMKNDRKHLKLFQTKKWFCGIQFLACQQQML